MPLPNPLRTHSSTRDSARGPSDDEILDLVAEGHHHAFDILTSRYGARVRRFVENFIGTRGPSEDITQEAFIRAFRTAGSRDERGTFRVWLYRVARNLAVDWMRREGARKRAIEVVEEGERLRAGTRSPLRSLQDAEFREHFEKALTTLPEPFRTAFVLREQEGLSYDEIAEVLGSTNKTVSTRIHRARVRLREALAPFVTSRSAHRGESPS